MGKVTITIETGNAAMNSARDVSNAIQEAADKVKQHRKLKSIRDRHITDVNGNTVGNINYNN